MKPNYVLQCLTSDKYGRITMLERPNITWLMNHVEKDKLKLDLPSKNYGISAEQIYSHMHDHSTFIVQSGIKKSVMDFDLMYEAIIFIYSPETGKYSPRVYRPTAHVKDNFMF